MQLIPARLSITRLFPFAEAMLSQLSYIERFCNVLFAHGEQTCKALYQFSNVLEGGGGGGEEGEREKKREKKRTAHAFGPSKIPALGITATSIDSLEQGFVK